MPGIATHFLVLERTIDALAAAGLDDIADAMRDNPYAYLGALGPAIGDFLPSDPPPEGTEHPKNYALIWKNVFGLVGGDPGLLATLQKIQDLLNQIQPLADNEDCEGLVALRDSGEVAKIEELANQFTAILAAVQLIAGQIFDLISDGTKPKFCTLDKKAPTPPPEEWPARDFLSWKKTGSFVRQLLDKADASGDDRLRAYAYGYLVAYSTSTAGSPFINSVVGGPSRTQWWRQRLIKNYTDAWAYGYYGAGASMSGDDPTPPYADWPSLCGANLHEKMKIGSVDPVDLVDQVKKNQPFPAAIPDDFADLWFEAVSAAYGSSLPAGLSAGSLNAAYLMTWLVLWFQTSGAILGCNLSPPMTPPDDCEGAPEELDPFNFPPGGSPPAPPIPIPDVEEDTAAIVCAILLAILGGVLLLGGGLAGGAAAIAGAVALLDCPANIDWKDFRCKLFWFRMYLFNGIVGLQRFLSLAGFTYPEAKALGFDTNALSLAGIDLPFESAINLVKSRGRDQDFPSKCWDGSPLSFNQRPTASSPGFETPLTIGYLTIGYPSFFIDDPANPLSNGDVKTNGGTQVRMDASTGLPVQFGNAVENSVDIFKHLSHPLPNWNLDGDRGLAYYTWQFLSGYDPDNVQIVPEP